MLTRNFEVSEKRNRSSKNWESSHFFIRIPCELSHSTRASNHESILHLFEGMLSRWLLHHVD